ncbi:pyrroline-5-carboxylate reductase [Acaryochloris sp. 'Moss Beach']|uniref:pyrroline-5-carboxylate reductase n=1 Tax=Acaryochloris sp. 'Moss Beach' TaxID=2740837 RepID=UPI00210386BC|nr:pyrroline-5-carboxylate reductase [Acaryochloris sp. 'Moss Beach']UJB69204.1 pyrroline-5-carboxylate reductase [Acaryochloris sp. 'Moss Beach']
MSQFCDQLGIIGGGVMAEAILSRLLSQEICSPEQVQVSDVSKERLEDLISAYQIQGFTDNNAVASNSQVLLLAIKPQIFAKVAAPLASSIPADCLVLSILAGVTLAALEKAFPGSPVVRVMPNTPATVGAGMAAITAGNHANQTHLDLAHQFFSAVGQAVTVPESLMDAVTGLSGSGPAYVALVLEALTDGGVSVGLPRPIAAQLALQTLLGTAKLVDETGLHPALLKDQVTSPGGTTIAGVAALEQAGLRSALIKAVQAAYHRSCELGQG